MMTENWRPDDWFKKPHLESYEAGADDMLEALKAKGVWVDSFTLGDVMAECHLKAELGDEGWLIFLKSKEA